MTGPSRVIGVDFDNTLVDYDAVLWGQARRLGLIGPEVRGTKQDIRDAVRRRPEGELAWQRLQAEAYGRGIEGAALHEGAAEFFAACRAERIPVAIISHKTQFAALDETKTDLRRAALGWMERRRFFEPDGLGLARSAVYFEPTRQAKIERIQQLGCTHFIDDLEETFQEPSFPAHVTRVLFAPRRAAPAAPNVMVIRTWRDLLDQVVHGQPCR